MKQTKVENIEAIILDKMNEYTAKTATKPTQLIISLIPYYQLKSELHRRYGGGADIVGFMGMELTILRTETTIIEVG
jgi:hypothetical protein